MNLKSGEMVFKKGFDLLGYADSSMSLEKYTELFHPEDAPYVHRLSQQSILWLTKHPEASPDFLLYISFRIMKRDGTFGKVLCRVSHYDSDDSGVLRHALVHLSDISFTDSSEVVSYRFRARGLDRDEFHRSVYKDYMELFTPREMQIIRLIEDSRSNEDISQMLEISKHTVSTHRKKILKKCGAHSADGLLLFCRRNGLL
jgi:DNA-binding CsgD family transcriptional regulator